MKVDHDAKGTTNLGKAAANNWQNDTASHPRRFRSSAIPLRELQSPQDILKILPQAQKKKKYVMRFNPSALEMGI